jgi:enterochelin esterase-like enzyme
MDALQSSRLTKCTLVFVFSAVLLNSSFGQHGSGSGFSLTRNHVYFRSGTSSLYLDLYTPGEQSIGAGIGVTGKDTKPETLDNTYVIKVPFLIWISGTGGNIFPTPVAQLVGNGYAIASIKCKSVSEIPADLCRAVNYLTKNSQKFNLDARNIGIIQPVENGYLAVVWADGMEKLKSLSFASVKTNIIAPSDYDFLKLQSSKNITFITDFFDRHLRNGIHKESDPLSLKCPSDSWVDPITNPIPETKYHLFPTPSRGKGTEGSYLIYLPKDYDSSNNRYPVIYWLHGGNGNSREGAWMCEKMYEAMQNGDMPKCVVVFVQGLPIGWYNNSVDGTMPVEDVVIKDLIPHIDATYRTIAKREGRGIDGMSMGGYGSLHLGFKYPDVFGAVSSIAPSITTYEMERKEVILPTFGNDTAYFKMNSPSELVDVNTDRIKSKTTIRLLIGDKDFLYDLVGKFHHRLETLGIDHQYCVARGAGHDYREIINNLEGNSFIFWKQAFRNIR